MPSHVPDIEEATPRRHARGGHILRVLLVVAVGLIGVGCGPTRTAGTRGVASQDLAVLAIPQLPEKAYVRIESVSFNGGEEAYPVKNGREFYLTPGDHTAGFNLVAIRPDVSEAPKWVQWMLPGKKTIKIPTPKKLPLGTLTAGKTYELAPPSFDSIESLWNDGSLSLVREKGK